MQPSLFTVRLISSEDINRYRRGKEPREARVETARNRRKKMGFSILDLDRSNSFSNSRFSRENKNGFAMLVFKVAKSAILGEGQKRIQNSGKSAFPSTFLHLSIRFKWTRRNFPIKWGNTKLPCDDCFSKKQLCHDIFPKKMN